MPRLQRVVQKIFANTATNTGQFGSLQANNPTHTSDISQIMSLSAWEQGWNSATIGGDKLPPLEERQGIDKVTTEQLAYILQQGIPEWHVDETYYETGLVKIQTTGADFRLFSSVTNDNTGNNPQTDDGTNWKLVLDSADNYAFDDLVVHKAGNETITGLKTQEVAIATQIAHVIKNLNANVASTPSATVVTQSRYHDANDNLMASHNVYQQQTDNAIINRLVAYSANGGSAGYLDIRCLPDGSYRAQLSGTSSYTLPATDSTASIPTTSWLTSAASAATSYMTESRTLQTNGYVKLRNGLLVQWGRNQVATSGTTISYSTAFQNSTVAVVVGRLTQAGFTYGATVSSTTATNFTASVAQQANPLLWIAIGY